MNTVIGMTDLLLETILNQQQKDFVEIIHDCRKSLMKIINNILDFSKIDSGKLELEQKTSTYENASRKPLIYLSIQPKKKTSS